MSDKNDGTYGESLLQEFTVHLVRPEPGAELKRLGRPSRIKDAKPQEGTDGGEHKRSEPNG